MRAKNFTVWGKNKRGVWQKIGHWQAPADEYLSEHVQMMLISSSILQPLCEPEDQN